MSETSDLLADALRREPWRSFARQHDAGKFGIWVFLASEVLFFGALMLTYTVCRIDHPAAFDAAGRETNIWYGTVNTAILLTSSLTMAVAAQAASEDLRLRRLILSCLTSTAVLGLGFLIVKAFEYKEDIDKHLVPGPSFALHQPGAELFYGLYWLVTGVHAIHLTVGIVLVGRLALLGALRRIPLRTNPEIEVTALYWHLVDVIWIFLYPLIYLPGRSS
jgi:cytochrome c oxidase subunit 3